MAGDECVRTLCNRFGFTVQRQTGSHVVLRKETPTGRRTAVVPRHAELKRGTLRAILEQAGVLENDFRAEL